ncbi:NRDE family protein [Marinoscillum furvescens]|uniref:Uncharacterized protein with NRDE domain n=1 Tax=Marinoscillum furvescens DSM 4134 TaxID=1122208 RepID=A0A3D9L8Y2_MARFU|nr:NRDE family protein [Marinoscillum furvescens]REE01736.1 uncharacterized protein with NRDE domain [Marinoscillum furvescens DSM 4134]
MCLIVFAWDVHPKYKLVMAANRDEFYNRPTAKAAFWEDHPEIFGGRDLKAGGTWMAASTLGKFAAVTNYRDLANIQDDARSRGELPTGFLQHEGTPVDYVKQVHPNAEAYNGFNLLAADFHHMVHYSNYERKINELAPGIYGLSNALLDTPWPKVTKARGMFEEVLATDFSHEDLLSMMGDTAIAADQVLPDTGLSKDMEKALSAMCIRTPNYGTCCSTVLTMDRDGTVALTEKSYPVGDRIEDLVRLEIKVDVVVQ